MKDTVAIARSVSAKGMLRMRTGRTFSIMPQSQSQTSPRLGTTFLLVEHGGDLVPSGRGNRIVKWTGIPRREAENELAYDLLFLFGPQSFKLR